MELVPFGVDNICETIEKLRRFIEINRRYFSEVKHNKTDAHECAAMLNASAKYCQTLESAQSQEQIHKGE